MTNHGTQLDFFAPAPQLTMSLGVTQAKKDLSWKEALKEEKEKPYFQNILKFIDNERRNGKIIYPPNSSIFNALHFTPLESVRAVILGQDPYHGPNQAHGLCFSVQKGIPLPPSLRNIFKELQQDLGIIPPSHGSLESWAKAGVLLLNASLSVEQGLPGSHAKIGWEQFTDTIIKILNNEKDRLVFLLWGAFAQKKAALVNDQKHLLLKAAHPSPFSADQGFFGCRHFSKTNKYLRESGKAEINWEVI